MLGKIRKSLKSNSSPFADQNSSKNSRHNSSSEQKSSNPKTNIQSNDLHHRNAPSSSQNINSTSAFHLKKSTALNYGCLVVLGANGRTPLSPTDQRQKTCFLMEQRDEPNGITKVVTKTRGHGKLTDKFDPTQNRTQCSHSITYSLSRTKTVKVDYQSDELTDMYQVGRSLDKVIDMVIVDDEMDQRGVKDKFAEKKLKARCSTISRFACRFLVDRFSRQVKLYAGGFDESNTISLGDVAPKVQITPHEIDSLTTNGVLMKKPGECWREVSINGYMYGLRKSRSANVPGETLLTENNNLVDNTLIDLCGCVLLYRDSEFLETGPKWHEIMALTKKLNLMKPQCPVRMNTLKLSPNGFKNQRSNIQKTQWPFVYTRCGHVHSDHSWDEGIASDEKESNFLGRTCPICRQKSPLIQLELGLEPAFLQDYKKVQHSTNTILKKRREGLDAQADEEELLSHCFVPCGHVTTSKTAQYWSEEIKIPKGTMNFASLCPFCLAKLDDNFPICRLIFQ